jgi:GR25 family glycosyltransferase involved in LPS biosynthesis
MLDNKNVFSHVIFLIFLIVFMIVLNNCNYVQTKDKHYEEIFQNIYLLNLKRRPDRLYSFLQCYNTSDLKNIQITKFNSIDGSKINLDTVPLTNLAKLEMKQLETTGFRHKHYQLTKGAIGCYLSHVKVWEHIYTLNIQSALIFEDDARPPPNTLHAIKRFMKTVPDDWDIILLGKYCNDCADMGTYHKVNRFILLHAYIISRRGVEKIIQADSLFPISQQLDAFISEIRNSQDLIIYAPKVNIVQQGQSRTDIQAPIKKSKKNNERLKLQ